MNEEEKAEERLKYILAKNNKSNCPNCGKKIDRGDIAWNNGSTEFGTGYSVIEIQCQACDTEIAHIHSWYAPIEDLEDLCNAIDGEEWE